MSLSDLIRDEIARRGPIPFRDFMELALYHPGHGYYASGRAAIGRAGDFFTNVSVGPLFGRLLARQFAEMWERLARPEPFVIVEQGAHRGDFAHDALTSLREFAPECFAAAEYHIVEPSAALAQTQRQRLAEFAKTAHWHGSVADLPPFIGVHFSNELLDAFPVHLVRWTGSQWLERHVEWRDGAFAFVDRAPGTTELRARLGALPPVPESCVTEINTAAMSSPSTTAFRARNTIVPSGPRERSPLTPRTAANPTRSRVPARSTSPRTSISPPSPNAPCNAASRSPASPINITSWPA